MLAEDQAGLDWLHRKSALERSWGVESYVLGSNDLRNLAPAVSENIQGAEFVPAEGYGDPLRSVTALLRLARAHGARILRGAEVTAIEQTGQRLDGDDEQGRGDRRTGGQRDRSVGGADGSDGGAVAAGDRIGAAGDRDGDGAGVHPPSCVDGEPASVGEAAGERIFPDRRRLVRRLRCRRRGGAATSGRRSRAICGSARGRFRCCGRCRWCGPGPGSIRRSMARRCWGRRRGCRGFYNAVTANGYTLAPILGQLTAAAILHGEAIDSRYRLDRFG